MSKATYLIILLLFSGITAFGQKAVPVYNFDELEPLLHQQNDTTYVVNFWATWCKPCVKELPAFEQVNTDFNDEKVRVILVSLDFIKNYDSQLIPFVHDREIESQVVLLNDPRSNQWIDKVSPDWSGAIPATLIYKNGMRHFFEQSFTYHELSNTINTFIKSCAKVQKVPN